MAKKVNKLFLTLNVGEKPEENITSFKRYIGIAAVTVTALNPSKKELEALYEREYQEPEYNVETPKGKAYRLEFHVKTDPQWANLNIDTTGRIRFLISDKPRKSKDETKVQVIDDYGETAWVTKNQFENNEKPEGCRVIGKYRVCHEGEADLVAFLKEWLNIPLSTSWNNEMHSWIPKNQDELEKCKIILDWKELVNGNLKELQDIIKQCAEYRVKVLFGIRTTEDNRHYSDICNRIFLRHSNGNLSRFDKELNRLKESGMYANTQFSTDLLHEWTVNKTTFTPETGPMPTTEEIPIPSEFTGQDDMPF